MLYVFIIIGYTYCEERENNKLFKRKGGNSSHPLKEMGFLSATKMKTCKECNEPDGEVTFRKWKNTCRACESKRAVNRYYEMKEADPSFLKRHADTERRKRRTKTGCRSALYNRAKNRAKRQGLDFTIDKSDIIIPEKCPILGIPLQVSSKMSDCSPSLDRIDPNKGYVKRNVQVISSKANTIKSNATVEEIGKVYDYMRRLVSCTSFGKL